MVEVAGAPACALILWHDCLYNAIHRYQPISLPICMHVHKHITLGAHI